MYQSGSQQETAAHSSTDTLRRVSGQRAEFLDMVVGRVGKPQGKCSSLGLLTSPGPEEVQETGCWNPGEKQSMWEELPERMIGAVTFQHRVQPATAPEVGNKYPNLMPSPLTCHATPLIPHQPPR